MTLPAVEFRNQHQEWLLAITQIPTAAGREWRVTRWLKSFVKDRPDLRLDEDAAGNLVIRPRRTWGARGSKPIYITAHLDHPAFVVHRAIGPGTLELEFRGGVMDEYFQNARVVVHAGDDPSLGTGRAEQRFGATLTGEGDGVRGADGTRLFKTYIAELDEFDDEVAGPDIRVGDIATWALPPAEIDAQGIVHTPACDDLSAVAAAVSAMDVLRTLAERGSKPQDVRLLFTRSEEIGFTGAIAAAKLKTMEKNARVIALENSRSFADSPIGGGPIVRVGDRMSIFDPRLTAACAKRAEQIAGHAASPSATQKTSDTAGWKWQRKLMAGGACEATVYCAYGYQATCLCLPLGNYHNMADLAAMQDGTFDREKLGSPRMGREFIGLNDYFGMVDLLVAIGMELSEADPALERIEMLYAKNAFVLEEGRPPAKAKSRTRAARPKASKVSKKTGPKHSKKARKTR